MRFTSPSPKGSREAAFGCEAEGSAEYRIQPIGVRKGDLTLTWNERAKKRCRAYGMRR